jgi:hypothetical protein
LEPPPPPQAKETDAVLPKVEPKKKTC